MARLGTGFRCALAGALLVILCGAPALAAGGSRDPGVPERAVVGRDGRTEAKPESARESAPEARPDADAPPAPDVKTLLEHTLELTDPQRAALASIFAAQGLRLRAAQASVKVDPVGGAHTVRSLLAETYRAVQLVLSADQRRSFARSVVAAGLGNDTGAVADTVPARQIDPLAVYRFLGQAVVGAQRRGAKAGGGRRGGHRGGGRKSGGPRRKRH